MRLSPKASWTNSGFWSSIALGGVRPINQHTIDALLTSAHYFLIHAASSELMWLSSLERF
jgi:hypothetical protein